MKNIQNLNNNKKDYIDFCLQTSAFPRNGYVLPQMVFRNFFRKYRFFRKIC